ncbi:hypothetical protein K7X08_026284 [Anisodus acutangulus]|uniref:Uncharacterized protein n=1 Tax=Anisodus acutangulus TaxID=402998 RepID=A0A9Q1LLD5_9SOLA|nr:hypothetical protein K7X08_026284 [Anisodus acutangulus]
MATPPRMLGRLCLCSTISGKGINCHCLLHLFSVVVQPPSITRRFARARHALRTEVRGTCSTLRYSAIF